MDKSKAHAEAISRAIALNEDPSQIERGFGGDSGAWSNIGKGLAEGLGLDEAVTDTQGEFASRYVNLVGESGEKGLLTTAQKENAKQKFSEKMFYGVGASLPIMAEIAVTTALTEGVGTIPLVARRIKQAKDLFGTSKAGMLFANVLEQGVKGYVSFAPTEETGATGVGEGVAQGVLNSLIPEKLIGGKYGKLLNYAIRTIGGATGETIQEVSGQYIEALNENGYNAEKAFTEAFGRTPEERWENLALIGSTSLLFSGAFNSPRLIMTKDALQKEIDAGKVPKEDVAAVEEIIQEIDNKIKSEEEAPADKTVVETKVEEDVAKPIVPTKEEETKEVPKAEIKEEPKPEQPRIEEPKPKQEAGSTTDTDTEQGKTEDVTPETEVEQEIEVESPALTKEKPKGVTLKKQITRKGKTTTVSYSNVDTSTELSKDKNGNTLHSSNEGFVSINSKGKVNSAATTKTLVKKYEQEYDYSKGETAKPIEASTEEEADRHVAESSQNPKELAELIERRAEKEAEVKSQGDTTKEGAIAEHVGKGAVNREDFFKQTVGDSKGKRKNTHESIPANYLTPKGDTLDIIAQNASETSGIEVTEEDVANFITNNPKGAIAFNREYGNDAIKQQAEDTFREITGIEPSPEVVSKAIGEKQEIKEEIKEEVTKESILKDVSKLGKGTSTNKIYKKAKEAGLESDPEISEAISQKAKDYNEYNKQAKKFIDDSLEFGEDLPFQKGSRKQIAGMAHAKNILKKLQKAIPGLEYEFDEDLDALGTLRDGKVIINPKRATKDTAIHEFAHLWTKILKAKNSKLYASGITLVKQNKELMDYISSTRPDLKTEEQIAEEALVTAIGEDGVDFLNTKEERSKIKKIIDAISEFIRKTFKIKRRIGYAEMSEMTLNDFTRMASEELLNEIEITKVTREDVEAIMSQELILNRIQISSNILTDRGANTIGKAGETIEGLFMSKGKLPQWVANLDNNTRSALNGWITKAGRDVKIFNKSLKEHIKENNLNDTEVDSLMQDINALLKGEKSIAAVSNSNDNNMSVELFTITNQMRKNIDEMSDILINGGYLSKDMQATINENLGSYITRSYEIHKKRPKSSHEWKEKLRKHTPEVLAKAEQFIVDQFKLAEITKIHLINNDDGNYIVTLENEFGNVSAEKEISRADIMSMLNKDGNLITDGELQELEADTGTIEINKPKKIRQGKSESDIEFEKRQDEANEENKTRFVDPKKYGINFEIRDADVEKQIDNILNKHLAPEETFGIAGLNKKNVDILKKRKDIPKEIRDLLGEIEDPTASYMETVSKMASLIEYSKFLGRLKEEGLGTLIWEKDNRPAGTVPIAAEGNTRWKPLDGMYTTPEFMSALQHYEKNSLLSLEGGGVAEQANAIFLLMNTFTKASLTKWNIPSNFRNHWGALMMTTRMGYANPARFSMDVAKFFAKQTGKVAEKVSGKSALSEKLQNVEYSEKGFVKSYTDFYKGMSTKERNDFDKKEWETMIKYDLISDNVGFNTYKESTKLAMKTSGAVINTFNKVNNSKAGKLAKAPREFMDKVYLAPDAAAKMFLFRNMKIEYSEAYPNLSEEQVEEKVANIIKDTMPTFSKMGKAAKFISRNPIVGAFASFTTEMVRNVFNQGALIRTLDADYKKNPNPALKKLLTKNRVGLYGMMLLVPTLSGALKMALGMDDEDEAALKSNAPEWEKNSWTLYLGKGKDGSIVGVDLSYVDPLAVLTKPLYAMLAGLDDKDKNIAEVGYDTGAEALGQFLGDEPLLNAILEARPFMSNELGKNRYGQSIAKPFDNRMWQEYDKLGHILKTMRPKVYDNFVDAKKAYIDKGEENNEAFGKKYDPVTFTFSLLGFGIRDRDILKSAKFNIGNDFRQSNEENVSATKKLYTDGDDTQEDLDKANKAREELFDKHILNIKGAKVAGATDEQIKKILNERSVNKDGTQGRRRVPEYWADQLETETYKPLTEEDYTKSKTSSRKSRRNRKGRTRKKR